MNPRNRTILEDFRKIRNDFLKLGELVDEKLHEIVSETGVKILAVEHRVKTEKSLAGKLERNGDWYQCVDDLTDLLGARVICFFADEVDKIGEAVEKHFLIDRELSSDKRAIIGADTFGYLSLHYICTVTPDMGYPPEVCGKKFEIQIRTILQHTWAAINHDLGYKSEFGVPRVITRQFARLAGLLELADEEFVRVRDSMNQYTEQIRQQIIENRADNLRIDTVSLSEFMKRNTEMRKFLNELAAIGQAEMSEDNPESYLEQLAWFGIETLGALQNMLRENHTLALALADNALRNADLDILSSNAALHYLCRAKLLTDCRTEDEITAFLTLSVGKEERARRQAKRLLAFAEEYHP